MGGVGFRVEGSGLGSRGRQKWVVGAGVCGRSQWEGVVGFSVRGVGFRV